MKSWTFLLEFSVGLHVYVLVWTVDTVTLPTVVQPDAAVVTRYTVLRKIIINCVCVSLFVGHTRMNQRNAVWRADS